LFKRYIGGVFFVVSGGVVVLVVSACLVVVSVVLVLVGGAVVVVVESILVLSLVSEALRLELHAEVAIINEPTTARLKIVFFIGLHLNLKI
jgi:hypothetical protein